MKQTTRSAALIARARARSRQLMPNLHSAFSLTLDKPKRHDHRSSIWAIAGGAWLWCYRCGAIRLNRKFEADGKTLAKWTRPTGPEGRNPAE